MGKDDFLRMAAPIVAAGTVYLAGRALREGYRAATGTPAPKPDDLDTPIRHVVLFAIATAAVSAVINVTVQRGVAKASANRAVQGQPGTSA